MKISTSKPFEELMKEATADTGKKLDFKFNKMLQGNDSRKKPRKAVAGIAYIYNENLDPIGKVDLADVSETGMRIKTSTLAVQPGSNVTIIIVCSGVQFEQVSCQIRWISDVDITLKCRQMGIEFATITPTLKESFFRHFDLKQTA